MPTYAYGSATNSFVPSLEAGGALMHGYARNLSRYAINRYLQKFAVSKREFYYGNWKSEQFFRITSANNAILPGNEFAWPPGQDAPSGVLNTEAFNMSLAGTTRYAYPFLLDNPTIEQAPWQILAANAGSVASQAMLHRTLVTYNAMNNAGFTTATATALGGGLFDAGTPTNPYLKEGLYAAASVILSQTGSAVEIKDLAVIMNHNTARKISASQELTDNFKFVAGLTYVQDGSPTGGSALWGLPPNLYGFELIVETSTVNTAAPGVVANTTPVIPDGVIFMVSKQGSLEGIQGAGSWSTVQGYFYEEFTVEQMVDVNNRVTRGRVVTDYTVLVPDQGKKSGYLITSAV